MYQIIGDLLQFGESAVKAYFKPTSEVELIEEPKIMRLEASRMILLVYDSVYLKNNQRKKVFVYTDNENYKVSETFLHEGTLAKEALEENFKATVEAVKAFNEAEEQLDEALANNFRVHSKMHSVAFLLPDVHEWRNLMTNEAKTPIFLGNQKPDHDFEKVRHYTKTSFGCTPTYNVFIKDVEEFKQFVKKMVEEGVQVNLEEHLNYVFFFYNHLAPIAFLSTICAVANYEKIEDDNFANRILWAELFNGSWARVDNVEYPGLALVNNAKRADELMSQLFKFSEKLLLE